jgi:8-oxo-dGTP pyrophosphatase MutT (NUDIX family)
MKELKVYPCVCGFDCERYSRMKHHREKCIFWRHRLDPERLMIARRRATRRERLPADRQYEPCGHCHRRPDHHDADCPNSQAESARRESLEKHGIDPVLFAAFLRVLARRYELS